MKHMNKLVNEGQQGPQLNNSFLSVIIPVHNEEKTICRTVESLLNQDYSNFEIIDVDDDSDDDTVKNV